MLILICYFLLSFVDLNEMIIHILPDHLCKLTANVYVFISN